MPIEGELSSLTIDASMMNKYGYSLCGTYAADRLGTIKSEVNHCPAAQQWAGQYSVNSANLCLRGIPCVVACIITLHLQNSKEDYHAIFRSYYRVSSLQRDYNKLLVDLGLNKSSFFDWERRGTIPGGEIVARIADYFHVSTDYLLGRTDDPRPVGEEEPTPAPEDGQNINIIKIAGRDGSHIERKLTDEQMAALKLIIDQLPDADNL